MKKNYLLSSFILITALVTSITVNACTIIDKKVKGNGNVIEQSRDVADFNAINASEGLNVFLKQGKENKVVVKADENLHEYILTEVKDGTLNIHVKNNYNIGRADSKDIYVTLVDINSLKASSGCSVATELLVLKNLDVSCSSGADVNVEVDSEMLSCSSSSGSECTLKGKSKEAKLTCSSGADMDININATALSCNASSGSDIVLTGTVKNLTVDCSSSADIEAFGLMAETCKAEASSGSEISVSVSKELIAHASSGGDIEYRGDPKIDIRESSGGEVEKD